MIFLGNGVQHSVWTKGKGNEKYGYVRKFPTSRNDIDVSIVQESVDFFKQKFGAFTPPTKSVVAPEILHNGEKPKYVVIQRRINGKPLNVCDSSEISPEILHQMLDFLDAYERVFVDEMMNFDLMGYQTEQKYQHALKLQKIINNVKQILTQLPFGVRQTGFFIYFIALYIHKFLFIPDIFSSSNIMID